MKQALLLVLLAMLAGALAIDDTIAFVHNNNRYATLDDVAWDAPFSAATLAAKPCVVDNPVQLPTGWTLAPNDDETRFVVQNTVFGTYLLGLADGTGWVAGQKGVWRAASNDAVRTNSSGAYVTTCVARILIKATGKGANTKPTYPYNVITNYIVFQKFKFATLDNASPGTGSACVDIPYTVPPGWQLAPLVTEDLSGNPGPDPRVPIGLFTWSAYLVVLADGSGWLAGQSTTRAVANNTLVRDQNGFRTFCSSRVLIYAPANTTEQANDIVINSAPDFKFSNTFVFEGYEYAAADDTIFSATGEGCQTKWIKLPLDTETGSFRPFSVTGADGGTGATTGRWEVAPYSARTKAAVQGSGMKFGANCLSLLTKSISTGTAADCDGTPSFTGILNYTSPDRVTTYYKPNGCSRRVLLRRTTTVSISKWAYSQQVSNKFTYYDKEFATLDNSAAEVDGVGGCTDKSYKLDSNWKLCNTTSPFLQEALQYFIQRKGKAAFGTVCLALADGGIGAGTGTFIADCNQRWLLNQTVGTDTYYTTKACAVRPLLCRNRSDNATSNVNYDINMKLLVISVYDNTADDPRLGPILAAVRGFGIPYDHYVAYDKTTGSCKYSGYPTLVSNGVAQYYGIIISSYGLTHTSGNVTVDCLSADFRAALTEYKIKYNVRLYSAYTVPVPSLNLNTNGAQTTQTYIKFASTTTKFAYGLNPSLALPLADGEAYRYPAVIWNSLLADKVTPVMRFVPSATTTPDTSHGMAVAIVRLPDGSDEMHTFVDSSENMFHGQALGTIYINWLTKGLYLGHRRNYLGIQIDDVFSATEPWNATCVCKGHTAYRITGADLTDLAAWQTQFNANFSNRLVIEHALNCYGLYTGEEDSVYNVTAASKLAGDTLLAYAKANTSQYFWVSHTWSHLDQTCPESDCAQTVYEYFPTGQTCTPLMAAEYDNGCYRVPQWGRGYYSMNTAQFQSELVYNATSYNLVYLELTRNSQEVISSVIPTAATRTAYYSPRSLVNPRISGLFNPNAVKAMYDAGIRYVVGDTSRTELWPYPHTYNGTDLNGGTDGLDWPPNGWNVPLSDKNLRINWYHGRWLTEEVHGYRDDSKYWRQIFMIPRFPTNIYYDSSSPAEVASEYNFFYGPTGILSRTFSVARTSEQILASEAERVTKYLLVYRWDPYMFHQVNLRSFTTTVDGKNVKRCMVALWVEAVNKLFKSFSKLPLVSLKQDDLGDQYVEKMEREIDCQIEGLMNVRSGVAKSIVLSAKRKSPNGCFARLTGVVFNSTSITLPAGSTKSFETYGPDSTLRVLLPGTVLGEANMAGGYPGAPLPATDTGNRITVTINSGRYPTWAAK